MERNKPNALKKRQPNQSHVDFAIKLAYAEALVELLFSGNIDGGSFRWNTQFYSHKKEAA